LSRPHRPAVLIFCLDAFSSGDLPQQCADDEPVKWQDDREINPAKQIVRQHQLSSP
jgi:hypothetical protein